RDRPRGENDPKYRAGAFVAVDLDLSAVRPRDAFGQGQPKAMSAAAARPVGSIESLEDVRKIRRAYAWTEILNGHRDLWLHGHDPFAVRLRVLHRVIEQHDKQSMQRRAISGDHRGLGAEGGVDTDLPHVGERAHFRADFLNDFANIQWLERHIGRAGVV